MTEGMNIQLYHYTTVLMGWPITRRREFFPPSFGAWLIPVPGKACREACSIMNLQMEGTRVQFSTIFLPPIWCWSKRLTRCFDCLVVCLYLCLFHNSTQHLLGILMFAPIFSNMSCIQNQHMVLFGKIVLSFSRVVLGHPSLRHDIQQCFEYILFSLKVKWLILSTTAVISNPGVWMLHYIYIHMIFMYIYR